MVCRGVWHDTDLWCPEGDLNPHDRLGSADFKSAVSADKLLNNNNLFVHKCETCNIMCKSRSYDGSFAAHCATRDHAKLWVSSQMRCVSGMYLRVDFKHMHLFAIVWPLHHALLQLRNSATRKMINAFRGFSQEPADIACPTGGQPTWPTAVEALVALLSRMIKDIIMRGKRYK
jgi:hypothetical protein